MPSVENQPARSSFAADDAGGPAAASLQTMLAGLSAEHGELSRRLLNPGTLGAGVFAQLSARMADIQEILDAATHVDELRVQARDTEESAADTDPELRAMAAEELPRVQQQLKEAEQNLRGLLLPRDPHAGKDVVMEIRAGVGGDEASLFAADLFKMYARYAERRGWTTQLVSESASEARGYKEIIFEVSGKDAYGTLRYESGVHRIQRIPATEKIGRVHTSTATVAVLPKATEVDITIRPEDLRIDTYRAGGHGGQKVQKTESAVRITHVPTGLVVQCQDERSQQRNKERALGVLRARLLAHHLEEQTRTARGARKAQIGTGDRSEKIRTYNVPQNRMTDHRIKQSWHTIDRLFQGELDEIIQALRSSAEEAQLHSSS